jgi:hypothetical protein
MKVARLLRSRLAAAVALGIVILGLAGLWIRHSAILLERDLTSAQQILVAASKDGAGSASDRIALISRARMSLDAAGRRLRSAPLRQVGFLPLIGRDVRVVRAMVDGAQETAVAGERLLVTLSRPGPAAADRNAISAIGAELARLEQALHHTIARVERTTPLVATRHARTRFLTDASRLRQSVSRGHQAAKLIAGLYGSGNATRYLLAFQNPGELRGTGGFIGLYGILRSGPSGPVLEHVEPTEALGSRSRSPAKLPADLASSYEPFGFDGDLREANIPPDLPSVGPVILDLYERSRRTRPDGLVVLDPLAAAEILRVAGPVVVAGQRLDAETLPKATMVDAYVRYEGDDAGRKLFLAAAARSVVRELGKVATERPIELARALVVATGGRHLQVYSSDRSTEEVLRQLGVAGSGTGPSFGDYLMPVGINAGGNKLDTFLDRSIRYDVRLQQDGGATAEASVTLHNRGPARGFPRYVIGPYDRRFKAGENRQFQELYVARGYGLVTATEGGRQVAVYAQRCLAGLMLGREMSVPAQQSRTLGYRLTRAAAVRVEGAQIRYRLLVRPQPRSPTDSLAVSITAPAGWRFAGAPDGFRVSGGVASWSGLLDRERVLDFTLAHQAG